jgi:anti-sigma regulatory factor (Ser/Thr protein kinase)/DNA-binding NarL/FixJ family response regulator
MGRVLVIQGEAALTDKLRGRLDAEGHEIESCAGDVAALQRVRERAFDVVVTDAHTAVSEDVALADELRRARPGLRIIVRAPAAERTDVITALRAQVFACFTPPFDDNEIVDMVRSGLRDNGSCNDIEVLSGLPHWITLRVQCRLLTAERLVRFLTELESTLPEPDRDLLITAFREMLLNAMEHGGGFDPEKVVEVSAARTGRAIVYHFRDPGMGFTPPNAEDIVAAGDPDVLLTKAAERAAAGLRPGGLGLLIVRQIVDELVYNERGNEVLLIKYTSS